MANQWVKVFLRGFRLPTMAATWQETVTRAEREDWGYHQLGGSIRNPNAPQRKAQ